MDNIILHTDSYKISHYKQYPPGTENVYSYFESRGGVFSEVVFFGLQYYLKKYLSGQVVTKEKIDQAEELLKSHFEINLFNRKGWEYILNKHNGKLPIVIKAVPEGFVVPVKNILMSIENTDPEVFWLTNYLETLLVQVWCGCTVATQSREMKKLLLKSLERTGNPALIDFKLHDFGFRGVSSVETAGIGAAAHLINFKGTDTLAGIVLAREYYNSPMAGFSIPASEHSTITSWGSEHEVDAMRNMLDQYPTGLVACVSDSYDIFKACSEYWGGELKEKVLNRNGVLIVRPDSGHPPHIVCKVLDILGKKFGYVFNEKGYKVLDPHIRVIQGDGIDLEMLREILVAMWAEKWSTDNIAFGSGGGLLQKLNRDTLKFAFKCSSIKINGKYQDVFKEPITDTGKQSKRGKLKLVDNKTVKESDPGRDNLETVFKNGEILADYSMSDIRERAKLS